jgi:large subunit ribosomal protein L21
MYAIFELAGYQFRAEEGATVRVPSLPGKASGSIDISDVLLIADGETTHVGTPVVDGAKIEAEIVNQGKSDKLLVYKYKRRTKYRRRRGHRQGYAEIKINKIVAP